MADRDPVNVVLHSLRTVLIAVCLTGVALLAFYGWTDYQNRRDSANASRAACERGKLDRADNAAGWTAHRRYIQKVTGAASVKEDVKTAAREASTTYARISVSLSERARVDCVQAFPRASLLP